MALDISQFDEAFDHYDTTIDGEDVRFHWCKPDPYDLIDLRKDSQELDRKMTRHRKAMKAELEAVAAQEGVDVEDVEGVERPTIEISATDYYPVLAFIARHIAKVDGLENGGKAVVWRELSQELQRTVCRRLHPFEAFDLLHTITDSAKLGNDSGSA